MWNRMWAEAVVIAVQTVVLISLCATIGVSGSDRKAEADAREQPFAKQLPTEPNLGWCCGIVCGFRSVKIKPELCPKPSLREQDFFRSSASQIGLSDFFSNMLGANGR